jgi:glycosyltransferase involved in cell wall biosynthesis
MNKEINIYYLCPDSNTPRGGVKVIYEHVDILNGAGFSAYVLHHKKGFRCNWFDNSTAISYQKKSALNETDYIVIPEIYDKYFAGNNRTSKKAKIFWKIYQTPCHKIIFNQHSYHTFKGQSLSQTNFRTIYNDKQIQTVMVVSEDNRRYLKYVFPDMNVFRVHNSIDIGLFKFQSQKKKQISFIPAKNRDEFVQLFSILKQRNSLRGWELVAIEHKSRREAARIFQDSLLFINLVYQEGFGLPSAEAMASGCAVIGYHGRGGQEFFRPEFCFPVETGNIVEVAKTVEKVLELSESNPKSLHEKVSNAAKFIQANYSPVVQKKDVIEFWNGIIR